jgi:hypothetical protein
LLILEIGSLFLPRLAWTKILFYASCCHWMTVAHHHAHVEMGFSLATLPIQPPVCSLGWQSILVGMGSHEVLSWLASKQWSDWSQTPKVAKIQVCATSTLPVPMVLILLFLSVSKCCRKF